MRVLVTGATGFLGGKVCCVLRDRGFAVVATGRSVHRCAELAEQGFEVRPADLSTPLEPSLFGALVAVVHAAALSAPSGPLPAFRSANVDATRNIVALARRVGVRRFVNISSPSVYFAPQDQLDVRESCQLPVPFNNYARTKAEAEPIVLNEPSIGPISLRPRGIYGPGDTALLPRLLKAAQAHPLPLFRGGRAKIDLTHVSDVCEAVIAALTAGPEAEGEVFNISGGEVLPIRQIIELACTREGIQPRWQPLPIKPALASARLLERLNTLLPGTGEPKITAYALALLAFEQSLNVEKAARVLQWQPKIRFDEGLEDVFGTSAEGMM
ncbi:NAD(P)-dependent oxidoreductase [uncultured Ruegeria sp.]|uniref:NAD-dependent epimerase/dehydratase family protein n=1 Tax=uncultured Ruegeria sp. TaxID=259304 RepID=UPI00262AD447|nr:NAD(P)-dependent oxidoreductase [uncultured Ruegeria sp.]